MVPHDSSAFQMTQVSTAHFTNCIVTLMASITTYNQHWYLYQKVAAFHVSSCSSNVQCRGAHLVIEQRVTAVLKEGGEHLCLALPRGPHESSAALCVTAVGVTPHHQKTHTAFVVPLGLQGHQVHCESTI